MHPHPPPQFPMPPQANGYHPPLDPVAHALGGLHVGQQIILQRLDRQDETLDGIRQEVTDGKQIHTDLTRRVVAIEARPPWTVADLKLTIGAIVVLVLVLLGKIELAQQMFSFVVK